MKVKATTNVYGIFGHPVRHSLSPVMHNSAFEALGLDCVYAAFDVNPEDIGQAAEAIRALGIKGINITIPHKESIIPFLDEIAPDAKHTGAVNTVMNSDGKLSGFNTDVGGFLRAAREDLDFKPDGSNVLLLGAGGAARAVMSAFCMNGAKRICIANRTLGKAENLGAVFRSHFKNVEIEAVALNDEEKIKSRVFDTDIIVNSTSAGMEGAGALELPLESLKESAVVYDLVYKPPVTKLVEEARKNGHKASGGLSMLLYQGAESFEIWTGMDAPVDVMKKAIL
ncbi:MAG: shikimate dehydrogenase [Deltaproteobacteria bacterium]